MQIAAAAGRRTVIERREHAVVPYQGARTDGDATLVLEVRARIDENVLAETDSLAKSEKNGGKTVSGPGP